MKLPAWHQTDLVIEGCEVLSHYAQAAEQPVLDLLNDSIARFRTELLWNSIILERAFRDVLLSNLWDWAPTSEVAGRVPELHATSLAGREGSLG